MRGGARSGREVVVVVMMGRRGRQRQHLNAYAQWMIVGPRPYIPGGGAPCRDQRTSHIFGRCRASAMKQLTALGLHQSCRLILTQGTFQRLEAIRPRIQYGTLNSTPKLASEGISVMEYPTHHIVLCCPLLCCPAFAFNSLNSHQCLKPCMITTSSRF